MKFGVFKLKKGKLSPYYVDMKLMPSSPTGMSRVISVYEDLAKNEVGLGNFDRISGIPVAGIAFASVISYKLAKPFFFVKEAAETHGRQKRVDGALAPGDRVLLVDDVVTTGKSIIGAASVIRGEGGTISDALVLIDRQEGGVEKVSEAGITVHSFIKIDEFAEELYESDLINQQQYEEVLKQTSRKAHSTKTTG